MISTSGTETFLREPKELLSPGLRHVLKIFYLHLMLKICGSTTVVLVLLKIEAAGKRYTTS